MTLLTPPNPIVITLASLPFILAAFQGITLSAVLWFKKSPTNNSYRVANRFLSVLLLLLSLLLIDHAADSTGYYYYVPYLIDWILPIYFLIGPLLWWYVRLQTSPSEIRFKSIHLLHLLPAVAQLIVLLPFLLNTEYDAKILFFYEHWYEFLGAEEIDIISSCTWKEPWNWISCTTTLNQVTGRPEFDLNLTTPLALLWLTDIDVVFLSISLVIYVVWSVVLLKRHRDYIQQITSNVDAKDLAWLTKFLGLIAAATCIFVVISAQMLVLDWVWLDFEQRDYIIYSLLAISVIYLGVLALRQSDIFTDDIRITELPPSGGVNTGPVENTGVSLEVSTQQSQQSSLTSNAQKYRNSPLTENLMQDIKQQLENHLIANRDFLDPDLSLRGLSEQISVSPHNLSQVINESIGMNFFEFVNEYRLEEVKQRLLEDSRTTVLQIATDAGFNSKSSFYSFFKKREGMTPSAWKKLHRNGQRGEKRFERLDSD